MPPLRSGTTTKVEPRVAARRPPIVGLPRAAPPGAWRRVAEGGGVQTIASDQQQYNIQHPASIGALSSHDQRTPLS
ncbi:MAG TPA: hypothetical protein VG101_19525 [Puia sp.]|nr:hypothetical protein [Puia sp.]